MPGEIGVLRAAVRRDAWPPSQRSLRTALLCGHPLALALAGAAWAPAWAPAAGHSLALPEHWLALLGTRCWALTGAA